MARVIRPRHPSHGASGCLPLAWLVGSGFLILDFYPLLVESGFSRRRLFHAPGILGAGGIQRAGRKGARLLVSPPFGQPAFWSARLLVGPAFGRPGFWSARLLVGPACRRPESGRASRETVVSSPSAHITVPVPKSRQAGVVWRRVTRPWATFPGPSTLRAIQRAHGARVGRSRGQTGRATPQP